MTDGPLPDRTPPSKVAVGTRTVQRCEVCGAPYLVAPTCAPAYHTCSGACERELRSRRKRGQPWSAAAHEVDRSWKGWR
jgi:hypothetical protein